MTLGQVSRFSLTRFKLIGGKKKLSLNELNTLILSRQAKNIRISGVFKELHYGWVRPIELADEMVPESKNWDMSDCRLRDGYLLRLRIEKRKVPTGLMQLMLRERTLQKESRREKPLSRVERKELREEVKKELLEHCLPSLSYVDAYWDEEKRHINLFTTSKSHIALFEEIFRDSFLQPLKLSMIRILPPILGIVDLPENQQSEGRNLSKITLSTPSMMSYT